MVGWHHLLNGHEFEQTLGDGEGQESLALLQSMGSQRVRHDLVTDQQEKIAVKAVYPPTQTQCPNWLPDFFP